MPVTVYTRDACAACHATTKQLEIHGVPFTEVNVSRDPDMAQKLVDDGWRAMPVVVTDTESWSGMNLPQLSNVWS